jgi:endonuclease/exonuclease/phosphatase family metal-dependent hydrolase
VGVAAATLVACAGGELPLRVMTFNIRHGRGVDEAVNLERTAERIRALAPDVVGLQEVDQKVGRSGGVDEPEELGRRLGMHAAFGRFLDLQGGRYGMAILSRRPIRRSWSIELPQGNEPRVALAAEIEGPGGEPVRIVNVHFDWVQDDTFRFAQASALAKELRGWEVPYVLLGDFNDGPDSRTLKLFGGLAREAGKTGPGGRFTFPSPKPEIEIDYIFLAPAARWDASSGARVIDDPATSDHRPVVADVVLRGR